MLNDTNTLPVEFNKIFTLTHEYQIFVPSTINSNQTIDNTEYVNKITESLAVFCGGATVTTGNGAWKSDTLGLIYEPVTIVSASALNFNHAGEILILCQWLKAEMTQEQIALKIDGKLFLI